VTPSLPSRPAAASAAKSQASADGFVDELSHGLAVRYDLSVSAVRSLALLVALLADDPLAPTAIRDPRGIVDRHVADSLVALELEPVRAARHVADLGAGAGLPGMPLAIALPATRFTLVESASRKCAFIGRAARRCGVSNVEVVCHRAESLRSDRERFDVVLARALAPLAVVEEYAAPLLALGGTLVVWRGRRDLGDEAVAARAADELGLELREILPVQPFAAATDRHLHLISKVSQTPTRFPRRPGIATKRPLGRN
jgi:16S rRNA (guanine527-N7)-methyltransferase